MARFYAVLFSALPRVLRRRTELYGTRPVTIWSHFSVRRWMGPRKTGVGAGPDQDATRRGGALWEPVLASTQSMRRDELLRRRASTGQLSTCSGAVLHRMYLTRCIDVFIQ